MIRQLAQCPYCNRCEVALDDRPALVFNPDRPQQTPCVHLAWVEGRYEQWEKGSHGVHRLIGSTEFRWDPPEPGAAERTEQLLPYLRELVNARAGWPFAPAEPFTVRLLSADEKGTDERGRSYPIWEVDGWAVFAQSPAAWWSALPACQERQLQSLEVPEDGAGA
jgi:hypothetical protein